MAERLQVYECELCGNLVEVLRGGKGKLVCCGKEMKLLAENTVDAAKEKHVPVVEKTDKGVKIKVGEVTHPMEEKHLIEFIEAIAGDKVYRKFLKAGDAPEAEFETGDASVIAREHCNLHGFWKT